MSKTIVLTGSTDGIGKLAAVRLAADGHHVCLHGRSQEKLDRVVAEVKESSGNDNVEGFLADFSDLNAVRQLGKSLNEKLEQIDVLINNAGVYKSSNATNENGLDLRFVVNYFAPVVLTEELLPLLEKGSESRVINLSSAAQGSVSEGALNGSIEIGQQQAYAQSKLALTMWSFELARQFPNMAVIAVNPGSLLNTNMVREGFGFHRSSADKGGNILYELAVAEKHAGVTGKYFDNDRGAFGQAHSDAYEQDKIEALVKATKEIISKNIV